MPKRIYPGETIGIIGATDAAALLAQAAGQLGYKVISLVLEQNVDNAVKQFVVDQQVTAQFDEEALRSFGKRAHVVILETVYLSQEQYQWLKEEAYVCSNERLAQQQYNRLEQKQFLDAQPVLVTPFDEVENLDQLEETLETLGYPAQAKLVERSPEDYDQTVMLYSEDDLPKAESLLEYGPAIIETWLPAERKLNLTMIRNEMGEVLLYPLVETIDSTDKTGRQYQYPSEVPDFVLQEIHRQAYQLANELELVGGLTLEFLLTESQLLYLADLRLSLTEASMISLGMTTASVYEAVIRAVVGLPLPQVRLYSPAAIALPLSSVRLEQALTQFMLRTDWEFVFLTNANDRYNTTLRGQIIVPGQSVEACQRQIDLADLYQI